MNKIIILLLIIPIIANCQSHLISITDPIPIEKSIEESFKLKAHNLILRSPSQSKNSRKGGVKRYDVYHENLLVIGAQLIEKIDAKGTKIALGKYVSPEFILPDRKLTLKQTKVYLNNSLFSTFKEQAEKFEIRCINEVLVPSGYPLFKGFLRRCDMYEIEDHHNDIPIHYIIYLDVITGEIVGAENKICQHNVPGKATTLYSGTVTIETDSVGPGEYVLEDKQRNIILFDKIVGGKIVDEDNNWFYDNKVRRSKLDAYYGAQRFHHMLKDKFSRDGIDDDGGSIICIVNDGFYSNAYWDREAAHFGAGDCANYYPFVTLDVVGHEFAHGLTQYTSGLFYSGEPGAINESMSDIFGKILEHDNTPSSKFTWELGKQISVDGVPFRNMADPNDLFQPNYYLGLYWESTSSLIIDNGGVHTNSGVINYWFYSLVNGKSGVNENNENYNVIKMGWEDASKLVYLMQTAYLLPSDGMLEFGQHSLNAAIELFGEGSTQYNSVYEACKAVGILNNPSLNIPYNLVVRQGTSFINRVCYDSPYHETFTVRNIGKKIAKGSTVKIISPEQPQINYERKLTADFDVEDTIQFYGDVIFNFSSIPNNHYYFSQNAEIIDTNNINNLVQYAGTVNYNFSVVEGYDLQSYFFEPYSTSCTDDFQGELGITNQGCKILPSDKVKLFIATESQSAWFETTLSNSFINIFYRATINLPSSFLSDAGDSVNIKIYIYNETISDWELINENKVILYFKVPLAPNEIIDFEDGITHLNKLTVTEDIPLGYSVTYDEKELTYRNPYWQDINKECARPADVAKMISDEFLGLHLCIDAKGLLQPKLLLDIKQEYNLSYNTTDKLESQTIIYRDDFQELRLDKKAHNKWITDTITLAPEYVGESQFQLYAQGGFIHIDNIRVIDSDVTSIAETDNEISFSIFPNPTNDFITVKGLSSNENLEVKIFSIDRKMLSSQYLNMDKTINVNHLISGFYLLECIDSKGNKFNSPFVKM